MKSLPTILIIFSLAFFLVGCPKPEAPVPDSKVKQTDAEETKTQDPATDPVKEDIPKEDTVQEKKNEILEKPVVTKEEPEAVETEQPPAQKKLKVATTVKESAKPADVKKVEPPEPTPEAVTQEQSLRSDVQEARAVLEEAIAKVEVAETTEIEKEVE